MMLAVLEFIFSDFWHFLGICVFMMIVALWKPIDLTVFNGYWRDKNDEN